MKSWLKRNASELPLMAFITTWLVLVWLFDPEGKDLVKTIVAIAIVVAVGKTIAAYVKWVAVDKGQLVHKGHTYYVVPEEHWEELEARSHFELAVNYLTKGDTDSAIREYQILEGLDKTLASELYNRIFS